MKPFAGVGTSNAETQPFNEMAITKAKKSRQVSFKVEDALGDRIEAAAEQEELPVADFVRKVFLWGLDQYDEVGARLGRLRSMALSDQIIEKTLKEERQVYRERARQRKSR